MDPITLAITSALGAGAVGAAKKVAENAIGDAYQALKSLLKKKFGSESETVKAVEALEAKPESEGRKLTLEEELKKANEDPEIVKAANDILAKLHASQVGTGNALSIGERSVAIAGAVSHSPITTGDQARKD
jgi:hypothetical protein